MGRRLTFTFMGISGVCAIFLFLSFIHFVWGVNQKKKGKSVDPIVKKCAFVSLFGYTIFVIISFGLYLYESLYYISSINIPYSTILCQAQTFNIVFFMTGKLSMYFFFMALVHVAFRGSFLAYPIKLIGTMAVLFFFLMCAIGGFYMFFLYIDFSEVGTINSPADCDKFEASKYSTISIYTGATCDAIWSFTCLLLFYLRLRKITKLMTKQDKIERQQTDEMIAKIKYKHSMSSINNNKNGKHNHNHNRKRNNKDRTHIYDHDTESQETERIISSTNNRKLRPTITEWNDDDDDEDEDDEKDRIETLSVVDSLPTSAFIGSPPTTNYANSAPSNTTGQYPAKVLSTVNELLPIPTNTKTNNNHKHRVNVTPSPSTSPPSTPKHKPHQHNHNGTTIVLQSRSDGSTLSVGTSNLSTITMDFATDADMDGIILDEGDEEDEENESTITSTNSHSLEIKTNTNNNMHSVHQYEYQDNEDEDNLKEEEATQTTQTQEYTLMKQKYQNAPQITYDDRRNSMSSSAKMFTSLKLKFDNTSSKIKKKIKRRNSWNNMIHRKRRHKKKKPDIVHKFLPIMLKLSILSAWCAFSTFGLGFGLWTIYPTLSSVIDSTINAFCVYLSFGFTKTLYELLCSPFISCKNCEDYRTVVKEANKMEKDKSFTMEDTVLG